MNKHTVSRLFWSLVFMVIMALAFNSPVLRIGVAQYQMVWGIQECKNLTCRVFPDDRFECETLWCPEFRTTSTPTD